MNIIPSITTSHKEITTLQLKELENSDTNVYGLFITGIKNPKERMSFLECLPIGLECPLVHVRVDSVPEELEYCLEHYKTKYFNLHGVHNSQFEKSSIFSYKKYMLAENSRALTKKQLKSFSGICLDLSHYFEDIMNNSHYIADVEDSLKNYPVIVNHISAARKDRKFYSEHIGNYNSDFDYLLEIPSELFGEYSFLELENTLKRQKEIKDYIDSILF
jgi:hypothetical protein